MNIGASSACFFPLETELALQNILDLGFKTCEVFYNTTSELEDDFTLDLRRRADENGAKIVSVHPFSAALESNCIFGEYERRFNDFVYIYEKHCHAAALLGADVLVIHGSLAVQKRDLPEELYFDRFQKLIEIGKKEGVRVCQENVVRFRSQDVEFLKRMRSALGNDFNMVFDVKQAIRSELDPFAVAEEFKNDIIHIHLSDNDMSNGLDCLPPGKGCFDYKRLFEIMDSAGYNGNYVIEIYSKGIEVEKELAQSKLFMEKF